MERKAEGSRRDVSSPGPGRFKQRKESLNHCPVLQSRLTNPAEEKQDVVTSRGRWHAPHSREVGSGWAALQPRKPADRLALTQAVVVERC